MKKDVFATLVTQAFVLFSSLLVYKLAFNVLGEQGFAEYSLARRNIAFLLPAFLLGLGVALPRYTSLSLGRKDGDEDKYFLAGFFILVGVLSIVALMFSIFGRAITYALFGDVAYQRFLLAIYWTVSGLVFHTLAYSYFRGRLQMLKANLLQSVNFGVAPLLGFVFSKSATGALSFSGLLVLATSMVVCLYIFFQVKWSLGNISFYILEILKYGSQRVLGDFGLAFLISLPSLITTHYFTVQEGGAVAFATSLVNMVGQVFAPIGLVFLPKISQLIGQKETGKIKQYSRNLLMLTIGITVLIVVAFMLFAQPILQLYLGEVEPFFLRITEVVMLSSVGYTIYVSMRSVIDACHEKSINTKNIIISILLFGFFVVCLQFFVSVSAFNLVVVFVLTMYCLAVLTLMSLRKVVHELP